MICLTVVLHSVTTVVFDTAVDMSSNRRVRSEMTLQDICALLGLKGPSGSPNWHNEQNTRPTFPEC